ncbi:hypothetical protein ACIGO9_28475 [Nocardia asteroides]|uniref:hypothetical protein n=1 Tax=Nocardia asteroides TaxID=1824 RepID=UPI0037C71ED1
MSSDHVEAASTAYALASLLDHQLPEPTELRLRAWAELFNGQGITAADAVAAVKAYYRKPGQYPIKPGDIIDGVRRMPSTSTPERIRAYIERWADYPYSPAIARVTGMTWTPPFPPPAGIDPDDAEKMREFHRVEYRKWISLNWTTLIQRALAHGEQLELPK